MRYLTTPRGTYGIPFIRNSDGEQCANDLMWGYMSYVDTCITAIKNHYEKYMLSTMVWHDPSNMTIGATYRTQYVTRPNMRDPFDDDCDMDAEENEASESDNNVFEGNVEHMLYILNEIKKHRKPLDIATHLMRDDGKLFEAFQKSSLYEHLMYYIRSTTPGVLKHFVMALTPMIGMDTYDIDHFIAMYTRRHHMQIIPRRHGKSFCISLGISAMLASYRDIKVMFVSKDLRNAKRMSSEVTVFLAKWALVERAEYKIKRDEGGCSFIMVYPGNTTSVFDSTHGRNEIRGPDPQVCYIDEALTISARITHSILALTHKESCKVGIYSSPTASTQKMLLNCISVLTKRDSGINFIMVNYFCGSDDHMEFAIKQSGCRDLIFSKPRHINLDFTNKLVSDVLTGSNKMYSDEMGIVTMTDLVNTRDEFYRSDTDIIVKQFSANFINYICSYECTTNHRPSYVYIYIDPSYNFSDQSGNGLCAVGVEEHNGNVTPIVLYMAELFNRVQDMVNVQTNIAKMVLSAIDHIDKYVDGGVKPQYFIILENNSSQACAQSIYSMISKYMDQNVKHRSYLYYSVPNGGVSNRDPMTLTTQNTVMPGYRLDQNKTQIVWHIMNRCNNRRVKIWAHLGGTTSSNLLLMERFKFQAQTFSMDDSSRTYSGKKTRTTSDDLIISFIMSVYFSTMCYGTRLELASNWKKISGINRNQNGKANTSVGYAVSLASR